MDVMAYGAMESLLARLEKLKRGKVRSIVDKRMAEFSRQRDGKEIFCEMCFCILTANYSAEGGIRIQDAIGHRFCSFPKAKLASKLKQLGHRFPNTRADYIHESRRHLPSMTKILKEHPDERLLRAWIVKNVKGLGLKEASHFLRNIGYRNLAIIDFHIIDLLVNEKLIEKPKAITPKRYLEIESVLEDIGRKAGLDLAELDLYLWYMETGKILK
jgi:N-glycosylase/DNA lyase